jgi:hypothetical protein
MAPIARSAPRETFARAGAGAERVAKRQPAILQRERRLVTELLRAGYGRGAEKGDD